MNTLGLSLIMKMGCFCSREVIYINNTKYEIKERLGEGGFSTIDLAENTFTKKRYGLDLGSWVQCTFIPQAWSLLPPYITSSRCGSSNAVILHPRAQIQPRYAIKRITCHSIDDQKIALQEIEYYKKLKHPNIIELIDSTFKGSADIVVNATSEVYMVLPYYRRGTLHDYLDVRSPNKEYLSITEILRIFSDVCQAVKYMHDMKPEPLAHRDLKTANICLTDGLSPIVMDLGSVAPAKVQVCGSQDAQKLQDVAAERCSMPYRAPELFNVKSYCVIDQRTDVWSLGCVLYAMYYFKSPFDAVYERGDSVALAVMSAKIHFPEETPFSQDAHDLVTFMLKENPSERPFIDDVIEKTQDFIRALENSV